MAIEPWEAFMDKHVFWYLRLPGNENKTWDQIIDERGQVDYDVLSPAQKHLYINAAARFPYRRLKRDVRNPPPGVRIVSTLLPVRPSYPDEVVRRRSEGDQVMYDGFAPSIRKAQAWDTEPVLLRGINWSTFVRRDCKETRRANQGHIWKAVREIGRGGYGSAWLWVRLENGVVQQRLVGKDVSVLETWGTPQTWCPDREHEIPMEVAIHRRAAIRSIHSGSDFVAKSGGFKLHSGLRMYRLATEYAEYRTLAGLILHSRYRPVRYDGRLYYRTPIPEDQQVVWQNTPKLPLEFVLDLFMALAKAVQHLNIKGIVHRDLGKLDNILLGAESNSKNQFSRWGLKPLVTDFGVAMPIISSFDDPEDIYENPGAISTLAPEQMPTFPPLYPETQDDITNIYQLGILMAGVITGGTWYDNFENAQEPDDRFMLSSLAISKPIRHVFYDTTTQWKHFYDARKRIRHRIGQLCSYHPALPRGA